MNKLGLCSVTFRNLTPEEIIEHTKKAELDGIEWGGDVHVPPKNYKYAKEIGELTKDAELDIISYGSYYKVGENNTVSFEEILETARLLSAPAIRVWAGEKSSNLADDKHREKVNQDTIRISKLAEKEKIDIYFEYHRKTLTDTAESSVQLMKDTNCQNVFLYWQPNIGLKIEKRIDNIKKIIPWLSNVHVFHWEGIERQSLSKGQFGWDKYIQVINDNATKKYANRYFMLEFVKNDDLEQFYEDASILKDIVIKNNH